MDNYIYLRALKHADHTVFCVEDGQKTYFDPVFNRRIPFSSGQQVKRSILTEVTNILNVIPAPTTFVFNVNKNALGEGEVLSLCNPLYPDQLLGGWMRSIKGGKEKTLKRRSPLSISSMRPLHPLLSSVPVENATFDRSDRPGVHRIVVRDESNRELTEEEIEKFLVGTDRSLLRKWIPGNKRATGLFVYDVAIDLRTLFSVGINPLEPEISDETLNELKEKGWIESENAFGKCLVMPGEERDKIIPALAGALLNWRITSNQARTFSPMETLAVAISDNANKITGAIRAKLTDDDPDHPKAKPVIDESAGAELFVPLACANYILTTNERADAMERATERLIELMKSYDYEKQV